MPAVGYFNHCAEAVVLITNDHHDNETEGLHAILPQLTYDPAG